MARWVREGACDETRVTPVVRGWAGRGRGRERGDERLARQARGADPNRTNRTLPLPDASELRLRQARQLRDLRHEARVARGGTSAIPRGAEDPLLPLADGSERAIGQAGQG